MEEIKVICPDCGSIEHISFEDARKYENCGDLVFIGERVAKSRKMCGKCVKSDAQRELKKRLPPAIIALKDFIEKEGF